MFHEIAHNTLYVKSATPFNESFAQFVGYHVGPVVLPRPRATRRRSAARPTGWHDEIVLGEFYAGLVQHRQTLYDTHPDSAALERGRADAAPVGARGAPGTGRRHGSERSRIGRLPERPVNNARLIGARIYRTRLDLFDRWFEQHGRDVRASVAALGNLMKGVEGDSAYVRLEGAVEEFRRPRDRWAGWEHCPKQDGGPGPSPGPPSSFLDQPTGCCRRSILAESPAADPPVASLGTSVVSRCHPPGSPADSGRPDELALSVRQAGRVSPARVGRSPRRDWVVSRSIP